MRLCPLFALFLALTARAQMNRAWTTSLRPFRMADNLCYVGSQDLVTTPAGNILINATAKDLLVRSHTALGMVARCACVKPAPAYHGARREVRRFASGRDEASLRTGLTATRGGGGNHDGLQLNSALRVLLWLQVLGRLCGLR